MMVFIGLDSFTYRLFIEISSEKADKSMFLRNLTKNHLMTIDYYQSGFL